MLRAIGPLLQNILPMLPTLGELDSIPFTYVANLGRHRRDPLVWSRRIEDVLDSIFQ